MQEDGDDLRSKQFCFRDSLCMPGISHESHGAGTARRREAEIAWMRRSKVLLAPRDLPLHDVLASLDVVVGEDHDCGHSARDGISVVLADPVCAADDRRDPSARFQERAQLGELVPSDGASRARDATSAA
jgi:hypothetical protein